MLFQNLADAGRVVEFEAVFREVQDNVRSAVTLFFSLLHRVFGRSVAAPFHRFGVFLVGAGDDFDFVGHHECRIEPQSEVTMILWFLYFSRNSSAPEKAIWLMYLSISSAVMPMP